MYIHTYVQYCTVCHFAQHPKVTIYYLATKRPIFVFCSPLIRLYVFSFLTLLANFWLPSTYILTEKFASTYKYIFFRSSYFCINEPTIWRQIVDWITSSIWEFQAQTWGHHVVYRNCFWHSEQFLYTTRSPHVLQKEELLTKIYLYWIHIF